MSGGSQIRLLYKPFGRCYGKPKVKCSDFLDAIEQTFSIVYGVELPKQHSSYQKLEAQTNLFSDGLIKFYGVSD
jgi:hypothetical protein